MFKPYQRILTCVITAAGIFLALGLPWLFLGINPGPAVAIA